MKVQITVKEIVLEAELSGNATAEAIVAALPVEAPANRWGDEVYFDCPVDADEGEQKQTMAVGDIGYWIGGGAIALFFGPTPASTDDRPRAAVPVVLVGKIAGSAEALGDVSEGDIVRIST